MGGLVRPLISLHIVTVVCLVVDAIISSLGVLMLIQGRNDLFMAPVKLAIVLFLLTCAFVRPLWAYIGSAVMFSLTFVLGLAIIGINIGQANDSLSSNGFLLAILGTVMYLAGSIASCTLACRGVERGGFNSEARNTG